MGEEDLRLQVVSNEAHGADETVAVPSASLEAGDHVVWRPAADELLGLVHEHPGIVIDPDPQCVVVRWALLPELCDAHQSCLDGELLRVVSAAEHDDRVRRLGGTASDA